MGRSNTDNNTTSTEHHNPTTNDSNPTSHRTMFHPTALLSTLLATLSAATPISSAPNHALATRDNPQYQSGQGTYTDGQGTYVTSDSVHHYASGTKCWTDYYVVNHGIIYDDWKQASDKIYCTGTSLCTLNQMSGVQTCETWSVGVEGGVEAGIFNFGVSLGYDLQKCHVAQDIKACNWNDGGCHVVWTRQQLLAQEGYARRRCDDGSGDYTAWLQDFKYTAPTEHADYGCGSKCSDSV
jgi:hypothetical protein